MILLALLLVPASTAQSRTSEDYRAAYEMAFRASFRTHFIEQCRASAKSAAAAKIDVTPICACVTDRLLATKLVNELEVLPSAAELQPLVTECIAAHPPATSLATP